MSRYDTDILDWSERQAALLRRLADGERVNDSVDWPNVIEEVESVGRGELAAVESLLTQAISHMLKLTAWPDVPAVRGWAKEARVFRRQTRRKFTEAMRQRIDLPGLYADALDLLPEEIDGKPPLPVPPVCPFTLDGLPWMGCWRRTDPTPAAHRAASPVRCVCAPVHRPS